MGVVHAVQTNLHVPLSVLMFRGSGVGVVTQASFSTVPVSQSSLHLGQSSHRGLNHPCSGRAWLIGL